MEDMARLALVEHKVRDSDTFYEMLQELLQFINQILDNPHENELRTIKSPILRMCYTCEAFTDYLKYIGLEMVQNEYIYPKEQTLSRLRISQACIERKISLCCGPIKRIRNLPLAGKHSQRKRLQLTPSFIQIKLKPILIEMRTKFNDMLKYEDDDLLQLAREQIPLVSLQSRAIERIREQQKKIKTGESKDPDMTFDLALLMELIGWFKYKYFSWVDKPPCDYCGGPTQFICSSPMQGETESCSLEIYKCMKCTKGAHFPRYNDPATLLRTRRGRCGEWANCFTLFCRALGYDTRFVYDDKDHVWCEVFDYDTKTWLHVDPCEATINTPLMYCHGWGKTLSYVFAFSRDDVQDVTWRYTVDHKEVLKRRTAVSEEELLETMLALRAHRHAQLPPARRRYLAVRTVLELAELMRERKPTDYESRGRISGSREWREERGEIGLTPAGHSFDFTKVGNHGVRYYTALDKYRVHTNGAEVDPINKWTNGVYECENIFRKVEEDWHQAYLAREEGKSTGSISWRFAAKGNDMIFKSISIRLTSALYENGCIEWTIQFDGETCIPVELGEVVTIHSRDFTCCVLRARLSGGRGDVAWQHAQLFRQPLSCVASAFEVLLHLIRNK
ncbi:unnamed protein product, partial [Brenthis ino]